jgi:hypothetical protein
MSNEAEMKAVDYVEQEAAENEGRILLEKRISQIRSAENKTAEDYNVVVTDDGNDHSRPVSNLHYPSVQEMEALETQHAPFAHSYRNDADDLDGYGIHLNVNVMSEY